MNFIYNNSVFFQRCLQGLLGVITLFFITNFLSSNTQGWYYTFSSIAAVFTIFDLGLSVVLVQLSAHLSNKLKWVNNGKIVGSNSDEFLSLIYYSLGFYLKLVFIFFSVVCVSGIIFFSSNADNSQIWLFAWISFIFFTSLNLLTFPIISIVEGSGKIHEVYCMKMVQNFFGSIFVWISLFMGYELWALSFLPAMSFLVLLIWLFIRKPILLKLLLLKNKNINKYQWKKKVWPLQWRVGLSWISNYLFTQIYTPLLFYFDGPIIAGQMGLSLTIVNMLSLLSQSWINQKIPDMARSVASKNWESFDKVFKYNFILSLILYLFGSIVITMLIIFINEINEYDDRVLPLLSFIGLFVISLLNHISGALNTQLRSYKKEPLFFISILSTIITFPIAFYGVLEFSVNGLIFAVLIVQVLFTLPLNVYFWWRFNREWRKGH